MIQEAALDMADMVEAVLEHLRGNPVSERKWVDVNALVKKQIEFMEVNPLFRYEMRKEMELEDLLPPIHTSPMELQEVLYNLVRNAGDAMEDTEKKVLRIRTFMRKSQVVVEVEDTGEGIRPEHLDKIFRPDFTTKPFGKGTGLGLSRVKEIVDAHAWKIELRTEPGRGTTFTLMIPVDTEWKTHAPDDGDCTPCKAVENCRGNRHGLGEE